MKSIVFTWTVAASVLSAFGMGSAWAGGPQGAQFLAGENLQDAKSLEKLVDQLTEDKKGKQFGKIKKVVIPSYYLEFRTVSGAAALRDWGKGLSTSMVVHFTNPDKAVMESISAEGLADLKKQFAAAGYEVVEAGDIKTLDRYKKLEPTPSGTIGDVGGSIGKDKFQAMFASANGDPIFPVIPGEYGWGMTQAMAGQAVEGTVWKNLGGDDLGVVRSRMIIDFADFTGETGTRGNSGGKEDYASMAAKSQVRVWLPSLCVTRKYIFFAGRIGGDDFGCVSVTPNVYLASKSAGETLGKMEDKGGKYTFTANLEGYKAAALEQVKLANALLVAKAKSFK